MNTAFDAKVLGLYRACRERGLRIGDYVLMSDVYRGMGVQNVSRLARRHCMSAPAMFGRLARLRDLGLVEVRRGVTNRNCVFYRLTPGGVEMIHLLTQNL